MTEKSIINDILLQINEFAEQNEKPEIEVECRYIIDPRVYSGAFLQSGDACITFAKKIIDKFNEDKLDSEIEQSVNFIIESADNSATKIRKMLFIDGQQISSSYYTKERLIKPLIITGDMPYRMNFSSEKTIHESEFNTQSATMARIKLRYSIVVVPDTWRLDITLTRTITLPNNIQELKNAKQQMLFPLSIMQFNEKAPWREAESIEFEMEYIGKLAAISMDNIIYADKFFDQFLESKSNSVHSGGNSEYDDALKRIAQIVKPYFANRPNLTLKQLGNQVVELDKNSYNQNLQGNLGNYYITDKVDGKRTMILLDYDNDIFCAVSDTIAALDIKNSSNLSGIYLADSEEYDDHTFYIFDVMMFKDINLCSQTFESRLNYFDDFVALNKEVFKTKPFIRLSSDVKTAREQIISMRMEKKPYETDGLILTPAKNENGHDNHNDKNDKRDNRSDKHYTHYNKTNYYSDMVVYKYKPIDKLSIDFLIKRCPQKLLGIKPYICDADETVYLLFCGVANGPYEKLCMQTINYYSDIFGYSIKEKLYQNHYAPIQFEPSDYRYAYIYITKNKAIDLDNQIGEFIIKFPSDRQTDGQNYKFNPWKLLKIREDRQIDVKSGTYFGNNYAVAESLWFNCQNPLNLEEELLQESKTDNSVYSSIGYFQKHESIAHKASRNFNSFVKSQMFETIRGTKYVLDMASGKGQDLNRYAQFNMGSGCVLFTEIDSTAIMELINRKHQFAKTKPKTHFKDHKNDKVDKAAHCMRVYVNNIDYNQDYKLNINIIEKSENNIPSQGFELIMCNLAFHYFLQSKSHVDNIIKFIDYYLKPGGRFIFSGFDGQKIISLLENKDKWEAGKDDTGKARFSIVKKYKSEILQQYGQQIGVLLPFSNDTYYDEYLINIKFLEKEFAKYKISLESNKSFLEFGSGPTIDAADEEYISLYHYYTFFKKEKDTHYKGSGKKFIIQRVK